MQRASSFDAERARATFRLIFPTPALVLLLGIGFIDLISTAMLHKAGLITELNPIMRVFIVRSEWLFAFVKALTLGGAWGAMAWYAHHDRVFVHRAALIGSAAYVAIWCGWFFGSR